MKNRVFCAAFALMMSSYTSSWSALVVRGGMTLANMTFDPGPPSSVDLGMHPGFNLAILGDTPINPTLHLAIGCGYETKGVKMTATDPYSGSTFSQTLNFNYLTLPFMFSFGNPQSQTQPSRFYWNIGLEPAINVSAKGESGGQTIKLQNVTPFDLGLTSELGGEFPVSPNGAFMLFGLGYTYGIINAVDDSQSSNSAHHYGFKLITGFKFNM